MRFDLADAESEAGDPAWDQSCLDLGDDVGRAVFVRWGAAAAMLRKGR